MPFLRVFRDELTSQSNIVEVSRGFDGLNLSTDIEIFDSIPKVRNGRVGGIISSKNLHGLFDPVRGVDILD